MRDGRRRPSQIGRGLAIVVVLVALGPGATVTGCGGGGGSSDGGLCSQCGGDPDGPCAPTATVARGPDAPPPCDVPGADPCTVGLACVRELGSAQRRCYPLEPGSTNSVQLFFECDGARPNASTPIPTATPTATITDVPTPTATGPTPTPSPEPTTTP
jgi:hypothetical protein